MSINDIWTAGGIIVVLSMIIQITPIKLNPWSWLGRAIGHALNGEIIDMIDEDRASNARYRILRFDDELRHNQRHTKEHFDQLLDDIDRYEQYCAAHPNYKNGKSVEAIENVRTTYRKCVQDKDFL